MKIAYTWLKDYLVTDCTPDEIAEHLTEIGLEVEGTDLWEEVSGGLRGVMVGEVLTCEPHPNADRLKCTTVNVGTGEVLEIVCGAPNVAAGQKVLVATVGAPLTFTDGTQIEIKKSKIRGSLSCGMICAEDELGLGEGHDGIMVLEEDAVVGTSAADYLNLYSDTIFEIGLTPNRSDAISHYGVARDLHARLQQLGMQSELRKPSMDALDSFVQDVEGPAIQVESDRCLRYTGASLELPKPFTTPKWMERRLRSIGLKPIYGLVDVTNYVQHAIGQPLHAFDARAIQGNTIRVRTMPPQNFIGLDGTEFKLTEEDLIIGNLNEAMCIAGVFGGRDSGVKADTVSAFIESACFQPVSIRRTAKKHGLHTDASFRYERSVDPALTPWGLQLLLTLLRENGMEARISPPSDTYPNPIERIQINLHLERMDELIGTAIPRDTVRSILANLDFEVEEESSDNAGTVWTLRAPTYRADVTQQADVVEEILRIYGFNTIPLPKKFAFSIAYENHPTPYEVKRQIAARLAGMGFTEMMNNSLTSSKNGVLAASPDGAPVVILNPLSSDTNVMRDSMLYGALNTVDYNLKRQQRKIQLFEFGQVYFNETSGEEAVRSFREEAQLALVIAGSHRQTHWNFKEEPYVFHHLAGHVEAVLGMMGIAPENCRVTAISEAPYSDGLEYKLGRTTLVKAGVVRGQWTRHFDVDVPVYAAVFHWDALMEFYQRKRITHKELPKYPAVRRDLALLIDRNVRFADMEQVARATEKKLLERVELFDVYEGKGVPDGKKSYALSFVLRDENGTLNDKRIDKTMQQIQRALEQQLHAQLR